MKTIKLTALIITAAISAPSFGDELIELYRNSDGWYEIDAPTATINSANVTPPFSNADGTKIELGGYNGALEGFSLIMDLNRDSNRNLRFGKHPWFGNTNDYTVGKLTIQNFTGAAVDVNSVGCESANLTVNDLYINSNTADNVYMGWNMKSLYFKNAVISNSNNVFIRYTADEIKFDTLTITGSQGTGTVIGGTKKGSIGSLTITDNAGGVHIGSDTNPTNQGAAYFTETFSAGNITATNNQGQIRLAMGSQSATLGSLTFANNTNTYVWVGGNTESLTVNGDVNISQTRLTFGADFNSNSKNAVINGNVNIDATLGTAYWINSFGTAAIENMGNSANPNTKVNGIVNLVSTNDNKAQWRYNGGSWNQIHTYITVKGLSGEGVLATAGINPANGDHQKNNKSIIEFANTEVYEFSGVITSGKLDDQSSTTTQHLDLVMNGSGTQILRIKNQGGAYLDSNITVENGTLLVNYMGPKRTNAGETKYNQLILNGGTFGLAAEYTPDEGGFELGDAHFNDIVWNGGAILLTFDTGQNFFSNIMADTLSLTGTGHLFIFDQIGNDWSNLELEISNFLNITSGISDEQIALMQGVSKDGLWEADFFKDNGVWKVGFAQIPESSTVAAILGTLALGFAAWRKKNYLG